MKNTDDKIIPTKTLTNYDGHYHKFKYKSIYSKFLSKGLGKKIK